jgi:cytoskeletal protein CcmA (bactofilin family)
MFSSKSKESAPAVPSASQPNLAQQQKRPIRQSTSTPSIISADVVVNGSLTSVGDLQIDGRVEGDVRGAGMVIGDQAQIHGDVYAEDLTVRGRIEGGIRARKVLLCSGCHVEGNILHEAFAVETGAFFEGNCRHSDDPLAEPPQRRSAPEYANRPAPAPNGSGATNTPTASASGLTAVARPLNDATVARQAPVTPKP